jgi:hypothetical protein
LIWNFDPLAALRAIGAKAVAFNRQVQRPYGVWVRDNIVEFLFAAGTCSSLLFCGALVDGLLRLRAKDMRDHLLVAMCVGLTVVLIATDLLGVNRGEVTRLWIFLGCLFQIPPAYVCARLNSATAATIVLGCAVLQASLGTGMIGFIVPG